MKQYKCKKGDMQVTVWDTPGLYDGTQDQEAYVQEMIDKCSQNIDLMIYCINSSVTRFVEGTENPEASVIRTLTAAFGEKIWKKTVIALTFANIIENFNVSWSRLCPSEKAKKFDAEILKFDRKVRNLIITEVNGSDHAAYAIKILPAGYYDDFSLPGREYWLSDLWSSCMETKEAFYSMNAGRIQTRQGTRDKDIHDIEHQPTQPTVDMKRDMLIITKFSAVGVVLGGCVGAAIGAVYLVVGALVGGVVLGGVEYFVHTRRKNK